MQKTTYTLAEAAQLLSCHKETLRRAIQGGELRAARLGREYRISRLDLQTFWTAQGGGELFAAQEAFQESAQQEKAPPAKLKSTKPLGPQQLTLPTE